MLQTTIFERDYAILWFHPQRNIVHHSFRKFIYGQEFHRVLETGLEILRGNGAKKLLSDDRNNSIVPKRDIDWSIENWIAVPISSCRPHWKIVLPGKAVGQATMKHIIE